MFFALYNTWEALGGCKILPRAVGTICQQVWEICCFDIFGKTCERILHGGKSFRVYVPISPWLISEWSQMHSLSSQNLVGLRYFDSPEYGGIACHDKPNPSWLHVMTKVKVYTLRGYIIWTMFLFIKKTCLLVQQEGVFSCSTGRNVLLANS